LAPHLTVHAVLKDGAQSFLSIGIYKPHIAHRARKKTSKGMPCGTAQPSMRTADPHRCFSRFLRIEYASWFRADYAKSLQSI
jgi:hypothetical protein